MRKIGGTVIERDGTVVEVNLNRTKVRVDDLGQLTGFTAMTDLSLEETAIGDDGLRRLAGLNSLVWLNLYKTRVTDDGLVHLRGLTRLEHLPLGETKVTDAGLAHLTGLRRLKYLGLRGDRISDAGLRHVGKLTSLTGLHRADRDQRSRPRPTEAAGRAQAALARRYAHHRRGDLDAGRARGAGRAVRVPDGHDRRGSPRAQAAPAGVADLLSLGTGPGMTDSRSPVIGTIAAP